MRTPGDCPGGYPSRQPIADAVLTEAMRARQLAADLALLAQRLGSLSEHRVRPIELAAYRATKRAAGPTKPAA